MCNIGFDIELYVVLVNFSRLYWVLCTFVVCVFYCDDWYFVGRFVKVGEVYFLLFVWFLFCLFLGYILLEIFFLFYLKDLEVEVFKFV